MFANDVAAGWVRVDLPGGSVVLTTAMGGVSAGTWASPLGGGGANMGDHVGDDPASVAANRSLLDSYLAPGQRVTWMNQVHSAICADAADRDQPRPTADALLSTRWELCPAVVVADCVPIGLLATDGSLGVAVHAGRAGLLGGVVTAAIDAARSKIGPHARLQAVIGAHICAACYEVSPKLAEQVKRSHPHMVTVSKWATPALDLRAAVLAELEGAGVEIAYQSEQCTHEDATYYSYRRNGPTGRQALMVIAQHAVQNHGKTPLES